MPLTTKSKWQKHQKPLKEQGMHEKRKQSWAELFNQLPPKPKKKKEPPMSVRDSVKARDHNRCQVCGREATSLHHILFRSQAPSRKNDEPNLVSLCSDHHTGKEGPHQSEAWRKHWEEWSEKRYPEYWAEVEKCQKHMI